MSASRIGGERRRFAPAGGQTSGSISQNNISNNAASTSRVPSGRGGAFNAPPSRYLVTVLPPEHLPHDPPHPRTSALCSGYGPPAKFQRGTLVPLYPTLSGQISAIAREYGLPSTGGIVVYLVELASSRSNSANEGLVGPRVSDEAWNLLWGQLFEEEDASTEDDESLDAVDLEHSAVSHKRSHSRSQSQSQSQHRHQHVPALPPMPFHHLHNQDRRAHSPADPLSDASSIADTSSALASEDTSLQTNNSYTSPPSSAAPYPKSSNSTQNNIDGSSLPASPSLRPHSRASRVARGHSSSYHQGLHGRTSRASLRSNRSVNEGKMYGEAVIVGKLEFDIDRRRGGGKWFDTWLESATRWNPNSPMGTPAAGERGTMQMLPRDQSSETNLNSLLTRNRAPSLSGLRYPSAMDVFHQRTESSTHTGVNPSLSANKPRESIISEASSTAEQEQPASAASRYAYSEQPTFVGLQALSSSQVSAAQSLTAASGPTEQGVVHEETVQGLSNSLSRSVSQASSHSIPSRTPSPEQTSHPRSISAQSSTYDASQFSNEEQSLRRGSDSQRSSQLSGSEAPGKDESSHGPERSGSAAGSHRSSQEEEGLDHATPRVKSAGFNREEDRASSPSPSVQSALPDTKHNRMLSQDSSYSAHAEEPSSATSEGFANEAEVSQSEAPHDISSGTTERQSTSGSNDSNESTLSINAATDDSDVEEAEPEGTPQYQQLADVDEDDSKDAVLPKSLEDPPIALKSRMIINTQAAAESEPAEESEHEETEIVPPSINFSQDPLRDVFPNDANTWADLRATDAYDGELSPVDDQDATVEGMSGLGILSPPPHHGISASASSSLDPFEYDNDPEVRLDNSMAKQSGDISEVVDLLQAHSMAKDVGLSSPISLEDRKRSFSIGSNEGADVSETAEASDFVAALDEPVRRSRANTNASSRHSRISSASSVHAASIALPESEAGLSPTKAFPQSQSSKSIASAFSATTEESVMSDAPRPANRGGGIPQAWTDAFNQYNSTQHGRQGSGDSEGSISAGEAHPVAKVASPVTSMKLQDGLPVKDTLIVTDNNGHQRSISKASVLELAARSRSSSVEMMDNLDEIERALQELSPRSLKHVPRSTLSPSPNFRTLFNEKDVSVQAIPGYESQSLEENGAPGTPTTLPVPVLAKSLPLQPSLPIDPHMQAAISPSGDSRASELSSSVPPALPLKYSNFSPRANDPSSPGAVSTASTSLPYANTPPVMSPKQVTFNSSSEYFDAPPSSAKSSKFGGLSLKSWSSKSGANATAGETSKVKGLPAAPSSLPMPSPSLSSAPSESSKSPRNPIKGFRFWQKEEPMPKEGETILRLATETSLPMSPASSSHGATEQAGSLPPDAPLPSLPKPNVFARIPRKSSLASLRAHPQSQPLQPSQSLSPNLGGPEDPLTPPLAFAGGTFPSPPTHTFLPAASSSVTAPRQHLPMWMPSYPPNLDNGSSQSMDTPPLLARGDSSTTQSSLNSAGLSPASSNLPFGSSATSLAGSHSLPDMVPRYKRPERIPPLESTPELGSETGPRFLGKQHQVSSAPVTPAYAEPSRVPSSGRLGKPIRAGAAKDNFRLSADADLTKLMSHMQAIDFDADEQENIPPALNANK